ncbi:ATP-binding protein [Nocardia arthritidis]|uniref:ArsR family transcriptional regulator n=1 Tax=Nocardia arthritidis TaxID=228602 RepID=A0A6G9YSH9_9NOCA|nr:ATP-binding protein [Nocardia arthritidis]QIS16269.1 ArsR family transcriptional regulator [Nocardia arthritidis]
MPLNLPDLIAALRSTGGDCTDVEVKSAAGGLPHSLIPTLSAFANHPGGGIIILGLDERNGFEPVILTNPQELKQGLAKKARAFTPPIRLTIEDDVVDDLPVIIAIVHECDPSAKPCRLSATGAAYLRGYDGDFQMSALEEQAFLASRQCPQFDHAPVSGAEIADLDDELVADFAHTVRLRDRRGLGRFEGAELLRRAGVVTTDGIPTVAGLLALGVHPQQWFPRYVIQAAAEPSPTDPPDARVRNQQVITGPIPRMLDATMEWAQQTFDTIIVDQPDGRVIDVPEYPMVAFRELIANALLHRDLDHWSAGMAVEVRLRRDRLVVSNPGGLYGITVDRLGKDAVTSARNRWLVNICQYLRSPDSGGRVVEALATGIPTINRSLTEAGLPPANYADAGIRFTAVLRSRSRSVQPQRFQETGRPLLSEEMALSSTQRRILDILASGPCGAADLAQPLGLSSPGIRKALVQLRVLGLVEQIGGRGKATIYRLAE